MFPALPSLFYYSSCLIADVFKTIVLGWMFVSVWRRRFVTVLCVIHALLAGARASPLRFARFYSSAGMVMNDSNVTAWFCNDNDARRAPAGGML